MTRKASTTEWGPKIARLLDEEGWTQKELADKAGLSENLIGIMVTHTGNPRVSSLRAVVEAFNDARALRGLPQLALWQLFAPDDLEQYPTMDVELRNPSTPSGDSLHDQHKNGQEAKAASDVDIPDSAVRAAINLVASIRELGALTAERAEEGRGFARRAIERMQPPKVHHGPIPTGHPARPRRRRKRAG